MGVSYPDLRAKLTVIYMRYYAPLAADGLTIPEAAGATLAMLRDMVEAAQAFDITGAAKKAEVMVAVRKYVAILVELIPLPFWLPWKSYFRELIAATIVAVIDVVINDLLHKPLLSKGN